MNSNDQCSLFLDLSETVFEPGEIIKGEVHLKVKKHFKPDFLILTIKGKEKTHWEVGVGKQHTEYDGNNAIFDHDIPLVSYNGAALEPGFEKVPFSIRLPQHLPPSFLYILFQSRASIRYKIKATLIAPKTKLVFKRFIFIRPTLEERSISMREEAESRVKSFCCFNKGKSKISVCQSRDAYYLNESAGVEVLLDNSECEADAKTISVQLFQKIRMSVNTGYSHIEERVISERKFPGLEKHDATVIPRQLEISLLDCIQASMKQLKSEMKKKEKQYADHFLQPTTESQLIRCTYFLKVFPRFKVWMQDCSSPPKVLLPVQLVPPIGDRFNFEYASSFMIPEGEVLVREEAKVEEELDEIHPAFHHEYIPPPEVNNSGESRASSWKKELETPLLE